MSNVVLGYPNISEADFDWIQGIRKESDKHYYGVVQPHFTFVFPTDKLPADKLAEHVKTKAKDAPAIQFRLDKAVVVEDDSKTFTHVFLVPSDGSDEINELHDDFYTDELASELREDIPFIPHVGIATGEKEAMLALADRINDEGVDIRGSIGALSVAIYDGEKVEDVQQIELAAA